MSYVAMTDSYPGYWGKGETAEEAIKNCRGWKGGILFEIDPNYDRIYVDEWASIHGYLPEDWQGPKPTFTVNKWRVGPRGKRTPLND